jgi:hypothetical protein
MLEGENQKQVTEYIEECMARREPMYRVLRLLAMQCIADGGYKAKQLESIKRDLIQVGGGSLAHGTPRTDMASRACACARRRTGMSTWRRSTTWSVCGCCG